MHLLLQPFLDPALKPHKRIGIALCGLPHRKAGTKEPRFFVPALVRFVYDSLETECDGLVQSSSSTSTILYFFCFFAPVAIAD